MTGPVARSAELISEVLWRFFAAERVAANDGFLQRRDPRVSVTAIAGLAVAVMLTRSVSLTLLYAAVTVALGMVSAVPIRRLLARSTVVPFVAALIVLPQTILMPGDPVLSVFGLAITDAGLAYVFRFTLRVGVCVSLLSLLVMTTPFSAIVAALADLRVPIALVWVLAVTYRYLSLVFEELQRLILARNSRTTAETGVKDGWRDARRIGGSFLVRTLDRGERVGRGIRARGGARPPSSYGRVRSVDVRDIALLGLAILAVAASGVVRWHL